MERDCPDLSQSIWYQEISNLNPEILVEWIVPEVSPAYQLLLHSNQDISYPQISSLQINIHLNAWNFQQL